MWRDPSHAPLIMMHCKVVRDIASKLGDWLFYDEQFRYIRQSAPVSYPGIAFIGNYGKGP